MSRYWRALAPLAATLLLAELASLLGATPVIAAGPVVRFITVTDLTPRSFNVVWLSSEPATPALRLFEGPDCLNEVLFAEFTPFPTVSGSAAIVEAAQRKGVMVVKAARLLPDSEYCVLTVTTSAFSNQVTSTPSPMLHVRTEKKTTRARPDGAGGLVGFENDLMRVQIPLNDLTASTVGALVLLKVHGATSPLSGFIGDGISDAVITGGPTGLALVDLNNLYRAETGESMDLLRDGTEAISARVLGGPEGFVSTQARVVPQTLGLGEVVPPSPCLSQAVCDGRLGDATADGVITPADAIALRNFVVGSAAIPACSVCADVTWDFTDDMKDALAVAQAAAGLRLLPW